jgi:hypothetical protein
MGPIDPELTELLARHFGEVASQFVRIDRRFDDVDRRFDGLEEEIEQRLRR